MHSLMRIAFGALWIRDQRREAAEHQLVLSGGRARGLWERHKRRRTR